MRVICIGYRDWSLKIYRNLQNETPHHIQILQPDTELNVDDLRAQKPDFILFYGWSWVVDKAILDEFCCLMLHPSPLPKYRGGSPIQNQIIRGERHSKVSIFIMNTKLDAGDLIAQGDLSLEGSIEEIFNEIASVGTSLTKDILAKPLKRVRQIESEATYFKRRTPDESEITFEELQTMPAQYLSDKIRMLQDPYPNAFIRTKDGKRLLIKVVEVDDR